MKKLLLFFGVTLLSLNSMAMGFPQNTCEQQRILSKNAKELAKPYQVSIDMPSLNTLESDINTQKSFVEIIANYVVSFFADNFFYKKLIAINIDTKVNLRIEYLAIKQDFEYFLVG